MEKSKECEGCALINCQGPIPSELNGEASWNLKGDTDVLFTSEAPGRVEIERGRPFQNPRGAGGILRQSLKQMDIDKFGILNVWRCRPPGNKLPEGEVPGEFCRKLFAKELTKFNQKITVPLGAVGLNVLTEHPMSIMKVRGRVFTSNGLLIMPMLHPAFLMRQRSWWRDWELDCEKLKRYLDTGTFDYIPLSARKVHQAKTFKDALAFIRILRTYKVIACDIETTSFNMPWEDGDIISVAFAVSPTEAYAIPWRFIISTPAGDTYKEIKLLLEDESIYWLWYNGPYDVQFLWAENIHARIDGDAMLEAHLLDERANVHSLKKNAATFLNQIDWEEGIKKYKIPNDREPSTQEMWRQIPEDELLEYNGQDTTHTYHLSTVIREHLGKDLCHYGDTLVVPAFNMLARARYVGFRVDLYKVKELHDLFTPVMEEITQRLVEISSDVLFNPNSPAQKLALLQKRGLKVGNTQRETLQEFEGDEAVDAMLEWSEVQKMNSTYVEGIVDDISNDLRVHPDWRLPVETGRLRCSDPNMLGMPRKAEEQEHKWKRRIKEQFIADPNTLLMHIDRRQSEFRCCLFLADETDFIKFLIDNPDADIHGEFALKIYGPDYTREQRVFAKMVVFGLQNNREAPSIARQFTAIEREKARNEGRTDYHVWTIREAQRFINEFFVRIPKVVVWKNEIMKEALTEWVLTSFFGRKRRFGLITWDNKKEVENEAVNFPISSMSSDLNLLCCTETMKQFGKYGVEVLVPIHDSGLLRIPKGSNNLVSEIEGMWKELVPKILDTDLPFPVDVTVGERWSDL